MLQVEDEAERCARCGGRPAHRARRCVRCRATELSEAAGHELAAHSARVAALAMLIVDLLDLDNDVRTEIELCALLHDVGKTPLPRAILDKAAALTDAEWLVMRTHTIEGERAVAEADLPGELAETVRATHERWDGTGYPDGLRGGRIPLAARVVFCADSFDAMTSNRPYRVALSPAEAVRELRRCAGRQFDPIVAEALAVRVERLLRYSEEEDEDAAWPAAWPAGGAPMA